MRMAESDAKKKILRAVERLFFLAKIEKGIREADAGLTVSHDEAKKRLSGE
jgi:predicted transcriptional regulator